MAAEPRRLDGGAEAAGAAAMDSSRFTCPVCLEVYDKPVKAQCGHIFCSACLKECLKPKKPVCGVCRSPLLIKERARELESQIERTETTCNGCHKNLSLSKMREHAASCSKYQSLLMEDVKAASKDVSLQLRDVPNRFTFPCPYCSEKNLDQEGLVEHCKRDHSLDAKSVVCPICASMPWGDPNYRSANFIEHIERRHRFSYDTFVDYDADEDDMMNQVLLRSLMDK
ncbi:E3 ubiquitin-protein ligase RNF114 [Ornithorhynchus anatinus]|uniref:E3 ubiquitin-protein ligase RNF114 n=1 Tax=Ornithorhynchus anatinus TaxID=9258 RepID=A0A6I8NT96_ORNAN|nr:E3 ubiquitin-protein ligase RNF114 [Ornithorhynchus anatinus]